MAQNALQKADVDGIIAELVTRDGWLDAAISAVIQLEGEGEGDTPGLDAIKSYLSGMGLTISRRGQSGTKKERIGVTGLTAERWDDLVRIAYTFDVDKPEAIKIILGLQDAPEIVNNPDTMPDYEAPKYYNTGFSVDADEKAELDAIMSDLPDYLIDAIGGQDKVRAKHALTFKMSSFKAGETWRKVIQTYADANESDS